MRTPPSNPRRLMVEYDRTRELIRLTVYGTSAFVALAAAAAIVIIAVSWLR